MEQKMQQYYSPVCTHTHTHTHTHSSPGESLYHWLNQYEFKSLDVK